MTSYYQPPLPGQWVPDQHRFTSPVFQPQPAWGGMDYYNAYALNPDPSLFDQAWNRVRNYTGLNSSTYGVGLHEARHWHRRAYGGLGELNVMSPTEIGHAAAYEAHRTWVRHTAVHEAQGGNPERQREALIGLAVAEASRLLDFAGRPHDHYTRSTASEAAAQTASRIFYEYRDGDAGEYRRSRSRYRSGSYDGSYAMDDPYNYGDDALRRSSHSRSGRSLSRHRSHSRSRHHSDSHSHHSNSHARHHSSSQSLHPPVGSTLMPYQGSHSSSYGGSYHPYSPNTLPVPVAGSGYAPSVGLSPMGIPQQPPYGVPYGMTNPSVNYPYVGNPSVGGVAMSPGQAIVIHKPRKHRHHSRRRRSRSIDGGYVSAH